MRCDTGEVLIVRRNGDAYVALNEEGNEVARIVPTDAVWAVEINDPYRAHVDEAASSPPLRSSGKTSPSECMTF